MTLNWIHIGPLTAASAAVLLCLAPANAQSGNPWNPYPAQQQAQPAPIPTPPAPKPKYYEEAPAPLPAVQNNAQTALPDANSDAKSGPSRFAPPDLAQRLSAGPQRPPNAQFNSVPFGYQGAPNPPNANPPAYYGQPQGYPQGNMMGGPSNLGGYGGYGPPIIGNNSWGGFPGNNGNNFSPFGFW